MAKGVFLAWELADLNRMLKAEEEKQKEMRNELADPESRLLQEAMLLNPPSREQVERLNKLLE
tara:strand:+ start:687 stop:875 length:189 start_codon:yes stop_codon:yes gene_type:complete